MSKNKDKATRSMSKGGAPFGGAYFLTFIGAAVYFAQHSVGFWGFILAMLKAAVWPAIVMHQTLVLLNV